MTLRQQNLRAILIQDVTDLLAILGKALPDSLLESFSFAGITRESTLQWIIREKIGEIFLLFAKDHWSYNPVYQNIMAHVSSNMSSMNWPIDLVVGQLVKVPSYHFEEEIEILFNKTDMTIRYRVRR